MVPRKVLWWLGWLSCLASFVLSAGVCALWVRSHFVVDHWLLMRGSAYRKAVRDWHEVYSDSGLIAVFICWDSRTPPPGPRPWRTEWIRIPPGEITEERRFPQRLVWFEFNSHSKVSPNVPFWEQWNLRLPHWSIALPLSLPSIIWLARTVSRRRRLRRRRALLCERCGYDLRGSTGRCPECGSAFESG